MNRIAPILLTLCICMPSSYAWSQYRLLHRQQVSMEASGMVGLQYTATHLWSSKRPISLTTGVGVATYFNYYDFKNWASSGKTNDQHLRLYQGIDLSIFKNRIGFSAEVYGGGYWQYSQPDLSRWIDVCAVGMPLPVNEVTYDIGTRFMLRTKLSRQASLTFSMTTSFHPPLYHTRDRYPLFRDDVRLKHVRGRSVGLGVMWRL